MSHSLLHFESLASFHVRLLNACQWLCETALWRNKSFRLWGAPLYLNTSLISQPVLYPPPTEAGHVHWPAPAWTGAASATGNVSVETNTQSMFWFDQSLRRSKFDDIMFWSLQYVGKKESFSFWLGSLFARYPVEQLKQKKVEKIPQNWKFV